MFSKKPEAASLCPFDKKACIGEACKAYVHIRGQDPQTGAERDLADCAIRWLPTLIIETNKEVRQSAASTDKATNEFVRVGRAIGVVAGKTFQIAEDAERQKLLKVVGEG